MSEDQTTPQGPWTVARLLGWTRDHFQRREIESPRLCAELLLAHAMGCSRLQLYTRHEAVPERPVLDRFRDAVRQVADGCPVAYITGTKEFFSLTFEVDRSVLIPRPETEVLVERAISFVRAAANQNEAAAAPLRILDLCTGSGCIAVSLARHLPHATLCASDISPTALEIARRNAARHGLSERVDLRLGDLLEPWRGEPPFDLIVSNPPYIGRAEAADLSPAVRDHEPQIALFAGDDGLDILRRIVAQAPAHLAPGGRLMSEIGYRQAAAVRRLLDDAGWRDIVSFRDDLQHERVIQARRPAGQQTQVA